MTLFILPSCGEDEKPKTHLSLISEQAEVVREIEQLIFEAVEGEEGKGVEGVADEYIGLVNKLKDLKREAGELSPPSEEERIKIAENTELRDAHLSLARKLGGDYKKFGESADMSGFQELFLILQDSTPLMRELGEGKHKQ